MSYNLIEKEAKAYVNELFFLNAGRELPFHNAERTAEILRNAKKIAQQSHVGEHDWFVIEMAAWFCNTGYILEPKNNPAAKSDEIARAFLAGKTDAADIKEISTCICAAHGVCVPETTPAKVLADAASLFVAADDFKAINKRRKKEKELLQPEPVKSVDWNTLSIELLSSHQFYTDYCKATFSGAKQENLDKLLQKQQRNAAETLFVTQTTAAPPDDGKVEQAVNRKPVKKKTPVKGVEVMFRMSSANNIRMSVMADNKAHIMITVNSIIVSVVFGLIVRNMDKHPELLIPSILLLFVNVVTIIYSVLATRPSVSPGVFTKEQVDAKSVNMLFYGSFYNMEFDDYTDAMKKVMMDSEFLYACLLKDLYWQGKVLGRKYGLLRKAYTVFLYGIVVSVSAFVIAGILLY